MFYLQEVDVMNDSFDHINPQRSLPVIDILQGLPMDLRYSRGRYAVLGSCMQFWNYLVEYPGTLAGTFFPNTPYFVKFIIISLSQARSNQANEHIHAGLGTRAFWVLDASSKIPEIYLFIFFAPASLFY
jgi:hypothetical protein